MFSLFSKKCVHSCFFFFAFFKKFLSLPFWTPVLCIPFFILFSSFLFLFLSPGLCLPLGCFSLRFFHLLFLPFFLCSLRFVFFFGEHIFLVRFVLPSGCDGFWSFFVDFRISSFRVFSTFLKKKKTFVLKSTFLSLYEKKKVFENVLKFDLCHTSPSVFNSCISFFWTLFLVNFLFFFSVSSFFSFLLRFFVSLSCESSNFVHFVIFFFF